MKRLILLSIWLAGLPPGLPALAHDAGSHRADVAASQPAETPLSAAEELAAAIRQAQGEAMQSDEGNPAMDEFQGRQRGNKGGVLGNMLEQLRTLFSLFPQALLAGVVIAAVCSLLGVFVILKRVVFIGVTLSEVAACGIAAGMAFGVHPYIGAGALTLVVVALLAQPFEMDRIPRDAFLGVIFVLASGLSILLVAKSGFGLQEVRSLLYGDLILTSDNDLTVILATLLPVLVWVLATVRPTLYTFLDREAAKLLGVKVKFWELAYFFALGLTVSAASKVAGAMLVFCFLVVAPAAALMLNRRLWLVMLTAALLAIASTVCGMCWSVSQDLPTNQTIAVTTCAGFIVVFACRLAQWSIGKFLLRPAYGSAARRRRV